MTRKKRHQMARKRSASRNRRELIKLVRRFIAASLAGGDPTIGRAAEAAELSVRTLQRRLSKSGLTFDQLRNEVRLELAIRFLRRSRKSVAEIARALGYADPAHFSRAFKSWTGEPPSAFRKRLARRCGCR